MTKYDVELSIIRVLEALQKAAEDARFKFKDGAYAFAHSYIREQYWYWDHVASAMKWAIGLTKQGFARKVLQDGNENTTNGSDDSSGSTERTSEADSERFDMGFSDGLHQTCLWGNER